MSALVLAIAVHGTLQFWQRACDAKGRCGLPAPLSEKFAVEGSVKEPSAPGQLEQFRQTLADGDRVIDFQVFWVAPPEGSTPYLVSQARVSEAGRLITECTQYAAQGQEVFFPVGACSGFLPAADGSVRQLGVTFYK